MDQDWLSALLQFNIDKILNLNFTTGLRENLNFTTDWLAALPGCLTEESVTKTGTVGAHIEEQQQYRLCYAPPPSPPSLQFLPLSVSLSLPPTAATAAAAADLSSTDWAQLLLKESSFF